MKTKVLHIKNMVCDRCIAAVRSSLENLNIKVLDVDLGKAVIADTAPDYRRLEQELRRLGFALVRDKNEIITERIKALLIVRIHYNENPTDEKVSDYLSKHLHTDYSTLSKIFSQTEGITIERYIILQKIERVKELIGYGEMNFSEIAYHLQYSSVSHLSRQFKQVTGMTLSAYKNLENNPRKRIDRIKD